MTPTVFSAPSPTNAFQLWNSFYMMSIFFFAGVVMAGSPLSLHTSSQTLYLLTTSHSILGTIILTLSWSNCSCRALTPHGAHTFDKFLAATAQRGVVRARRYTRRYYSRLQKICKSATLQLFCACTTSASYRITMSLHGSIRFLKCP